MKDNLVSSTIATRQAALLESVKERLRMKETIGITNAIGFTANQGLIDAVKAGDREAIIDMLAQINNLLKLIRCIEKIAILEA